MFTIYCILVDVMRLGVGPDEEAKQDVQLWIHQDISPSNALKRLHRKSKCHYTYRHSRDRHLRAALAVATADKTETPSNKSSL
jgi:hypothetical protein